MRICGLQMVTSHELEANERIICHAIEKASSVVAYFLLTPEGSLSGYYADFDRVAVAEALQRVVQRAKGLGVGLLLGTCFKQLEEDLPGDRDKHEYCYDQVRVYAPTGEYLGAHSKILTCSSIQHPGSGEMRDFVSGPLRVFSWNGIRFGVLICNDLWATPGFTTTSNPYLAWHLKMLGAQVILHAVNAVGPLFSLYRPYHESNQNVWARALETPIVTTNAVDGINPSNCRAGVVSATGERTLLVDEFGEQFFYCELPFG